MITKDNICDILLSEKFGFEENSGIYTKHYGTSEEGFYLNYNHETGEFGYPEGVETDRNTTVDSHQKESYVVFLCVAQMFSLGYKPNHFKLEGVNYSGTKLGYCDILVKDNNDEEYLIIECKTAERSEKDDEFSKHWNKTLKDGDQLFRYFNTYRKARYLCLFAADYIKYKNNTGDYEYKFENIYNIISLEDNPEQLKTNPSFQSFQQLRKDQGASEDFFKVWKVTYNQDFTNRGLLEEGIEPFKIGNKKYDIHDLHTIDAYSLNKKYNDFAVILRKHTVSSHENAFDKLVNLFISKIIDETDNREELKLQWKGAAYDDYYSLQDRLNILYREGMRRFFDDTVTYVETREIDEAFKFLTKKADEGKRTIHSLFRALKYYSNNPFAFIDVHNESLFYQNSAILRDVILMLQDIHLTANEDNQFLGDLFEGFLNKGVHQSEGQFFTPMPIVRFLVSALPLKDIIENSTEIPMAIDYACGAGHFLTEYARQIRPFVLAPIRKDLDDIIDPEEKKSRIKTLMRNYYENITGIEKDYRLSKVSQVAAYMYNLDGMKIIFADALSNISSVKNGIYDVLVANPPYSVRGFLDILSDEERCQYKLSKYVTNTEKNNAIEVFFIERAEQLLKDNGVAAIILPVSVLTKNNLFMSARELLLKKFDIISICAFGKKTFGQTSTNTITLFLRRKNRMPDIESHINNRVEAWFSGDMTNDDCYDDNDILDQYVFKCGFDYDDYVSMMNGNLTTTFLETDIGEEYVKYLNLHKTHKNPDSTGLSEKAKEIREEAQAYVNKNKGEYKDLNKEEKEKVDRIYLTRFIQAIEKEKLYYYMLASFNPQQVLIVTAPSSTTDEKNFLGYEISTRKGNEGIKYLNLDEKKSKADDEIEDDTISQIRGIDEIITPLFNPKDLEDVSKINTLIRNNFKGYQFEIPDDLSEIVNLYSLEDLLTFSNATFNKAINLTPPLHYPSFETSFDTEKLKKVAPYVTEKKRFKDTDTNTFISTINMLPGKGGVTLYDGTPNIDNVTSYKKGDILISNIRPYLKKIWYADKAGVCSNDVLVFRNTGKIENDYLFQILSSDLFFDYMMVGKTGLKMPRGDKKSISNFKVPIPPPDIQKTIVKKCKEIDKQYFNAYSSFSDAQREIRKLFDTIIADNKDIYAKDKLVNILIDVKGNKTKIKKRDIKEKGLYPVITQERGCIVSGYTDCKDVITDLPIILFGDHSCSIKYIDFDFVRGADGTQLLKVDEKKVLTKYLYGYLLSAEIPNGGKYERHFKYLKDLEIKYPKDPAFQMSLVKKIEGFEDVMKKAEKSMHDLIEKKNKVLLSILNQS